MVRVFLVYLLHNIDGLSEEWYRMLILPLIHCDACNLVVDLSTVTILLAPHVDLAEVESLPIVQQGVLDLLQVELAVRQ
jgi:hypothetical protein